MTKEEIANKHHEIATENSFVMNDPFGQFKAHADFTIQHSDLQNKELTERVKVLESKLTELRIKHNFLCKQYNKLCEND